MRIPERVYKELLATIQELKTTIQANNPDYKIEHKASELRKEFSEALEPIFSKLNKNSIATANLSAKVNVLLGLVTATVIAIIVQIFR